MENTTVSTNETPVVSENTNTEQSKPRSFSSRKSDNKGGDKRGGKGGRRGGPGRGDRPKPEFDQKTLDVRRVTRVVSGGRRFTYSVSIIAGDKKGRVGMGMGKALDTALAIDKAYKQAIKRMVVLKLTKDNSIPHELSSKFSASRINLMPNKGRGLIAGSSARVVLAMAGIQNVTAKMHSGSKNKINNARAVLAALAPISTPFERKANREEGENKFDKSARGQKRDGARPPRKAFFVKRKGENAEAPKAQVKFEE